MVASLRIAFVAPFGLRKKTTVWARILPLARYLHGRGHFVHILIPPWDSPQDAGTRETSDGVVLEYVSVSGGPVVTTARLLGRLHQIRPTIVHVIKPRAYAGLVQWSLWYGRRLIAPSALLFLDLDDWEQAWAPITRYPWPVESFLAWQEEWGIRHADAITAASHWLVEKVRSVSPQISVHRLPNGISPLPYTARRPVGWPLSTSHPSAQRILFFSRFIEVPPDWLARFIDAVRRRIPHAQLVIVGKALQPDRETQYQDALQTSASHTDGTSDSMAQSSSDGNVEWVGYLPHDQLEQIYATVDCAIFPAVPSVLQQAKCSVRLATTLLHGVPCIASRVGEQQYYGAAGAAQIVSATAAPEEFAETVIEVLTDRDKQSDLTKQAQHHLLTNFDWHTLGDGLEKFYLTQIARRSSD